MLASDDRVALHESIEPLLVGTNGMRHDILLFGQVAVVGMGLRLRKLPAGASTSGIAISPPGRTKLH